MHQFAKGAMNHKRAPTPSKGLDVFGAVEELHNLSAKEMNKLLRDSQHLFTLRLRTGRGSFLRVNLERLVSRLPIHLLACLASRGTEPRLRYLLRGVRLLHSLSDLALRHPKLEQIFLQEVKIREQILDLIIYMLITLAGPEQEGRHGSSFTILHAALVACSLHLLPAFVAGEWSDLVPVLLVHPKIDIFMDAAFDAVRRDIGLLHMKLRALNSKLMSNRVSSNVAESMAEVIAQQCEASVQVLQSLCQPHVFRDKVLNHKELCRNGGVLHLVLTVLNLHVPFLLAESKYLVSLVARLKSKILSLMVKFCETESVSFLDEVAADVRTMHLAETVAAEVFTLVRKALIEEPRELQESEDEEDEMLSGLLYIHAMRLADIFSDDSNFRNSVMDFIAPDLAKVLAQSPTTFLSRWCGSSTTEEIKPGSDSVLIYDPFRAAGAAMHSFKSSGGSSARASGSANALLPDDSSGCSLSAGQLQFASYSQERSSLFVKILANLHCFNPEICPANEKDRFLNLFVECLMAGPFTPGNSAFFLSTVQTAVRVCENLFLLLDHVSSLSSEAVSDEDLQLVSTFYCALHDAICPSAVFEDSIQEDPVVAYVRDAHEQKRKALLSQWQRSERWRRIHSFEPSDDKEQSNAGSSINKTTSNSSSSQQAVDEQDTLGFVEEAQNFDELPVAKRSREASEAEEETAPTRKRHHSSQQWEVDTGEMEWTREGVEIYEKNNVLDAEVAKYMVETIFLKENDLPGYPETNDLISDDYLEPRRMSMIKESNVGENLAVVVQVHGKINGTGDTGGHFDEGNRKDRERETFIEDYTGPSSGEIIEAFTSRNLLPSKDTELSHVEKSDAALRANDGASTNLVDVSYEKYNYDTFCTSYDMEEYLKGKELGNCHKNHLEESDTLKHIVDNNVGSVVHLNSQNLAIHCDSARINTEESSEKSDLVEPSSQKGVDNVVQMHIDSYKSESATNFEPTSLVISNVAQNLSVKVENENAHTIVKITLKRADVASDSDVDAHDRILETRECAEYHDSKVIDSSHLIESIMTQQSSVKSENKELLCVQHDIDLKFKLKVEGVGVHEIAARLQPQNCCDFRDKESEHQDSQSVSADVLKVVPGVDVKQETFKNEGVCAEESSKTCVLEASQGSVMEASQVPAPGASHVSSQAFIMGGSQVSVSRDSVMYTPDASRVCATDASRFCPVPEVSANVIGNCPLPNPILRATSEELQQRKRKRNIMSDEQMAVMENALLTEPYLRRHPDLIMQWTNKLNKMGPEISYQQLKNWLNNRKARLARQRAGDLPIRDGEVRVCMYSRDGSAPGSSTCSGSSNDPNRSTSEDGANTRDSGSTSQARKSLSTSFGIPLCKLATEDIDAIMDYDMGTVGKLLISPDLTSANGTFMGPDAYGKHSCDVSEVDLVQGASHRSAPVKFVKCEAGQFVSLLDKEGKEAATGTLHQVEGVWQGKRIDELGICIVRIMDLNVDKSTRLPHPSILTGNTFEEAEKLCGGQMIVAWDTKRIFLIS